MINRFEKNDQYNLNGVNIMSQKEQQSNPQKESNEDKGEKDSNHHTEPQKKPNEAPENPIKELK